MTESTLEARPARRARDRVYEALKDRRYHSVYELEHAPGLKSGDWVVAVRELIEFGFVFGRRSNSLILAGQRTRGERAQDLFELLSQIDARQQEDANGVSVVVIESSSGPVFASPSLASKEPAEAEADFPVVNDTSVCPEVAEGDRIEVSVTPGDFVLSAKHTITFTQAILAKKRSGKSYMAMVIAEQLLALKMPFVVVDPTGAWSGLLSMADGSPSPHNVLLLGGRKGFFPLAPHMGTRVANLVVKSWPSSIVLDLSEMSPEEQHLFVADLCTRIYTINRRPVHFFFDEADEWAPQVIDSSSRNHRRCLAAVDRFVRRGGMKGLGCTLITQRPAVVSKNVLYQVGRLIVLNLVGPLDLAAVDEWMRLVVTNTRARLACLSSLPHLQQGEAFALTNIPEWPPLLRFSTRPKITFDSSRTPTMEEGQHPEPMLSAPSEELAALAKLMLSDEGVSPPGADSDGEDGET